jgi:hypothetical protein
LETHPILLALLTDLNPASLALVSHGVTRESVQAAVLRVVVAGAREESCEVNLECDRIRAQSGSVPPSRQARQAYLGAIDEAQRLGYNMAHWGHALLGLLLVTDGIAFAALQAAGVDTSSLRCAILAEMAGKGARS